jgi:uncharacterized protein
LDVVNNESSRRFEVIAEGHTAFLQYARSNGRIELLHTDVPPALGGKGIVSLLAKAALEFAREASLKVTPTCPFVKGYLERHPEYDSLL